MQPILPQSQTLLRRVQPGKLSPELARELNLPSRAWVTPKELADAAACSVDTVLDRIALGKALPQSAAGVHVIPGFYRPYRIPAPVAVAFVTGGAAA